MGNRISVKVLTESQGSFTRTPEGYRKDTGRIPEGYRKDTGRIPEGCQTSVKRPVRKPGIALQLYLHAGRIPEGYRKDTGRDEKMRHPDTGLNGTSHMEIAICQPVTQNHKCCRVLK